jgi:hypothetical protein
MASITSAKNVCPTDSRVICSSVCTSASGSVGSTDQTACWISFENAAEPARADRTA